MTMMNATTDRMVYLLAPATIYKKLGKMIKSRLPIAIITAFLLLSNIMPHVSYAQESPKFLLVGNLGESAATSLSDESRETEHIDHLVSLIYKRLQLAEGVSVAKYFDGTPVDNPEQERKVLQQLRAISARENISTEYVHRVFSPIITSMKDLEYFYLAEWEAHPDRAPSEPQDNLSHIRSQLSILSDEIVHQLAKSYPRLSIPKCTQDIKLSVVNVIKEEELNPIYASALKKATSTLCNTY